MGCRMPAIISDGDQCTLTFEPGEVMEINDTWIEELVQEHYDEPRKMRASGAWASRLETWVETEGRTFDV